jgi:hypothetical protein
VLILNSVPYMSLFSRPLHPHSLKIRNSKFVMKPPFKQHSEAIAGGTYQSQASKQQQPRQQYYPIIHSVREYTPGLIREHHPSTHLQAPRRHSNPGSPYDQNSCYVAEVSFTSRSNFSSAVCIDSVLACSSCATYCLCC